MASESYPFFPPELEREIFETAAEQYSETIPELFLVAHRVHGWIERVRYRVVTPEGQFFTCSFRTLLRAVQSNTKPPSFFHDCVQHLFTETSGGDQLEKIISVCSGIQSFVGFQPGMYIPPSLGATRPRRLSLFLKDLVDCMDGDLARPMFTSLTHLDLFDVLRTRDDVLSRLSLLPALTHLAVWDSAEVSPAAVLSRCSRLEALVHMHDSPQSEANDSVSVDDPRVVCMAIPDEDYEEDWVIGTRGGSDFWARADLFIARKRRGEIEPSSRCWIEERDGI
ncbi:hypothetical protein DFH06DRAFT_1042846 [Mycena polygramma]|nr:hypothetical protein DFH06DRAFT_1042846 [Mycena polygramma]